MKIGVGNRSELGGSFDGGGAGMIKCGRSASLLGNEIGSFPEGFTSPKRILAIASPPRWPGYQDSKTAFTLFSQGIRTGSPFSSTTMVWEFAAATCLINSS